MIRNANKADPGRGRGPSPTAPFLVRLLLAPAYRSMRGGSGREQVFGGFLTDSGGSKEERGLQPPTPFTKWNGEYQGGFEANYIFLYFGSHLPPHSGRVGVGAPPTPIHLHP